MILCYGRRTECKWVKQVMTFGRGAVIQEAFEKIDQISVIISGSVKVERRCEPQKDQLDKFLLETKSFESVIDRKGLKRGRDNAERYISVGLIGYSESIGEEVLIDQTVFSEYRYVCESATVTVQVYPLNCFMNLGEVTIGRLSAKIQLKKLHRDQIMKQRLKIQKMTYSLNKPENSSVCYNFSEADNQHQFESSKDTAATILPKNMKQNTQYANNNTATDSICPKPLLESRQNSNLTKRHTSLVVNEKIIRYSELLTSQKSYFQTRISTTMKEAFINSLSQIRKAIRQRNWDDEKRTPKTNFPKLRKISGFKKEPQNNYSNHDSAKLNDQLYRKVIKQKIALSPVISPKNTKNFSTFRQTKDYVSCGKNSCRIRDSLPLAGEFGWILKQSETLRKKSTATRLISSRLVEKKAEDIWQFRNLKNK